MTDLTASIPGAWPLFLPSLIRWSAGSFGQTYRMSEGPVAR